MANVPEAAPLSETAQQHEYEAFCRWWELDGAKHATSWGLAMSAFYAGLRYGYKVSGFNA